MSYPLQFTLSDGRQAVVPAPTPEEFEACATYSMLRALYMKIPSRLDLFMRGLYQQHKEHVHEHEMG